MMDMEQLGYFLFMKEQEQKEKEQQQEGNAEKNNDLEGEMPTTKREQN